ncbi:MAG: hypothetical protein R3Y11_12780 [Pseudomonadota bacterium]
MRGSIKSQITAVLKHCTRIGMSRHEAKIKHGGKSPFIHSFGTLDKVTHRLWPLQDWLKNLRIRDLEALDDALVAAYLADRFDHHLRNGSARKTFQTEVSALGNLERGLTLFSASHRTPPRVYDFSLARKSAAKQAKGLPLKTGRYSNRATSDPLALIKALPTKRHQLMAYLQLYCGCRCEGVGAPRRKPSGNVFFSMKNFQDIDGTMLARELDPVTGLLMQPLWTKEKGGKMAQKLCPLWLADAVMEWCIEHSEGLGDAYETYLGAINHAMKETGQYVRGKGTHSLRFSFAQARYAACIFPNGETFGHGMCDESAKLQVSNEMSHNRPDITESYLK